MAHMLKQALCNEAYEGWDFAQACKSIKKAGYEGIEIAPFTLAEDPATVTAERRREVRDIMASEGLIFAGLHWLMVSPKGLHVTTPDETLRARSWQHIRSLIDLCADLGPDGVMVFGSPKQRTCVGGLTRAEATRNYVDGLADVAAQAGERGVTILIEALPHQDTDVVLSLEEAVGIVDQIGHPAIRTMFDSHNAINETEPHPVLVDRYFDYIHHVHINELDGRHPGTGNYDFYSLFEVLHRRGYKRWVSMEAFDFTPGAEALANESLRHVEVQLNKLEAASA
jgi:D-psicose/D-tagatose/L-ribulose 3-epimerase